GQVLDRIPVAAGYRREAETIPERATLPEVLRIVAGSRSATFPVVSDAGELVGLLAFGALRALLLEENLGPLVVARDLCEPHFAKLSPEASLGEAFRLLEGEGVEDLPVVAPENPGRVVGCSWRRRLLVADIRAFAEAG